jgi:beta-galactosidase
VYGDQFYRGMPVLTRNRFGKGDAWYVASSPEDRFLSELADYLCGQRGIRPLLEAPSGIEVSRRIKEGHEYLFLLNHNEKPTRINIGVNKAVELLSGAVMSGEITIPEKDVFIMQSPIVD